MPHKFDPARRARLENPERERLLPAAELLTRAGLRVGMRLADVGCGPGFFTLPAAAAVGETGEVVAIDVSEEMLKAVREKVTAAGLRNVRTLWTDGQSLPLPDGSADVVLLAFVLHETDDPQRFAGEVGRILAPAGRVLLMEWEPREMPMGPPLADRLTPDAVSGWLAAAGLRVAEHFAPNPYHYALIAHLDGASSSFVGLR